MSHERQVVLILDGDVVVPVETNCFLFLVEFHSLSVSNCGMISY